MTPRAGYVKMNKNPRVAPADVTGPKGGFRAFLSGALPLGPVRYQ